MFFSPFGVLWLSVATWEYIQPKLERHGEWPIYNGMHNWQFKLAIGRVLRGMPYYHLFRIFSFTLPLLHGHDYSSSGVQNMRYTNQPKVKTIDRLLLLRLFCRAACDERVYICR